MIRVSCKTVKEQLKQKLLELADAVMDSIIGEVRAGKFPFGGGSFR